MSYILLASKKNDFGGVIFITTSYWEVIVLWKFYYNWLTLLSIWLIRAGVFGVYWWDSEKRLGNI